MNALLFNLTLACSFTNSPQEANDPTTVKVAPVRSLRVGQIWIVGNERTKMNVILREVDLYPGWPINYQVIRRAEKKLAKLGIFKNPTTIEVLDGPLGPASEYKDIIIHVEEDNTATANLTCGRNCDGDWVLRMVVEERNFDPWCFPTSWEDVSEGRAFRGAGKKIGLDFQFKLPLVPLRRPSVSLIPTLPDFSEQ